MAMLHFMNDYSEGAHPRVMRALADSNLESTVGYGCDDYCAQAADALRARFACLAPTTFSAAASSVSIAPLLSPTGGESCDFGHNDPTTTI